MWRKFSQRKIVYVGSPWKGIEQASGSTNFFVGRDEAEKGKWERKTLNYSSSWVGWIKCLSPRIVFIFDMMWFFFKAWVDSFGGTCWKYLNGSKWIPQFTIKNQYFTLFYLHSSYFECQIHLSLCGTHSSPIDYVLIKIT